MGKNQCGLLEQPGNCVSVIGFAGGGIDHTLNNVGRLAEFADRLRIQVVDDLGEGFFLVDRFSACLQSSTRVSIIPLAEARIETIGLQWDIKDEVVQFLERSGTSNRSKSADVEISVHDGRVLFYIEGDATDPK